MTNNYEGTAIMPLLRVGRTNVESLKMLKTMLPIGSIIPDKHRGKTNARAIQDIKTHLQVRMVEVRTTAKMQLLQYWTAELLARLGKKGKGIAVLSDQQYDYLPCCHKIIKQRSLPALSEHITQCVEKIILDDETDRCNVCSQDKTTSVDAKVREQARIEHPMTNKHHNQYYMALALTKKNMMFLTNAKTEKRIILTRPLLELFQNGKHNVYEEQLEEAYGTLLGVHKSSADSENQAYVNLFKDMLKDLEENEVTFIPCNECDDTMSTFAPIKPALLFHMSQIKCYCGNMGAMEINADGKLRLEQLISKATKNPTIQGAKQTQENAKTNARRHISDLITNIRSNGQNTHPEASSSTSSTGVTTNERSCNSGECQYANSGHKDDGIEGSREKQQRPAKIRRQQREETGQRKKTKKKKKRPKKCKTDGEQCSGPTLPAAAQSATTTQSVEMDDDGETATDDESTDGMVEDSDSSQ